MQKEVDMKFMQTNFGGHGFSGFKIWLLFCLQKPQNFSFGPWGSKNRISSKIMQVEVNVKCIQTNFGGHGHSGFRDCTSFEFWPIFPFGPWTIVHMSAKFCWAEIKFWRFYKCPPSGPSNGHCWMLIHTIILSSLLMILSLTDWLWLENNWEEMWGEWGRKPYWHVFMGNEISSPGKLYEK